jgi:hypothetical protein
MLVRILLGSRSSLLLPHLLGFPTDIVYLLLCMKSMSDEHMRTWMFLTSVKHSPGVQMRNPSSPWGIHEHGVVADCCEGTYFVRVGSYCRLRSEIVLDLLGNDLFVDVPVWNPVFVLL